PAEATQKTVLNLARAVAHTVDRPAAPLTAYLLGLAVGGGAPPGATAAKGPQPARGWAPGPDPPPPPRPPPAPRSPAPRLRGPAGRGRGSICAPRVNLASPPGIGPQAGARVTLLTDPAPRLPGVASTVPSSGPGASHTGTQSSTSGEEVQSQDSCARCQARSGSRLPCSAQSSGSANSSKITAAAIG